MNILALDVATKCGWCTDSESGTWDFRITVGEPDSVRLMNFYRQVSRVIQVKNIKLVAYERTAGFHANAMIVQSELHGVMKLACAELGVAYMPFSAGTIKKFATGKGNAKKPQMIEAAESKYGKKVVDDNEADAIHLYHLAKWTLENKK